MGEGERPTWLSKAQTDDVSLSSQEDCCCSTSKVGEDEEESGLIETQIESRVSEVLLQAPPMPKLVLYLMLLRPFLELRLTL